MTETMTRTLATDKVSDIIQVDTVRVTKVDMAKAEKVAKADRLGRLVAESAAAVAIVDERERSGLVALVDTYRSVGDPIVVAIRDGLVKGVRDFAKRATNGETTASGRYVNESHYTRGARIAEHWQDGETTDECVARFYSECEKRGITEFVRWIGGSESRPADPDKALRAALRAYYKSGGIRTDAEVIATEEWQKIHPLARR